MCIPKDLFDIRYAIGHKQKHSLFPMTFLLCVCVSNRNLDCESEEKSSHKFPIAILHAYAYAYRICRYFALAKYRLCYHRLEIGTRNDKKSTRNLWKTDSTIDETE